VQSLEPIRESLEKNQMTNVRTKNTYGHNSNSLDPMSESLKLQMLSEKFQVTKSIDALHSDQ
jgi:hypothetical protein